MTITQTETEQIYEYVKDLCTKTKKAAPELAAACTSQKNAVLQTMAALLRENADCIAEANCEDLGNAVAAGTPAAMLDRLKLDAARIEKLADSLCDIIRLSDPVGEGETWTRPNGLQISRIRVPLGVVGAIYESRPNVTVDIAALCIKTGNACVLRGGKDAVNTNRILSEVIRLALHINCLNADAVSFIDNTDRESSNALMTMRGLVDVLIPRGGTGLIRSVVENARVPVIETGAGNCHLYIDASADLDMGLQIAVNAKLSRPSVCNAIETLLVHRDVAATFLPMFEKATRQAKLEIRGCPQTQKIIPDTCTVLASEEDYYKEYNDYIIAVKVIDSLDEAISHIAKYSTGHSEAIVTHDIGAARRFQRELDSAAVYVNASTRFTDGGEFGFGAEIGISTQKLHARGPMGLREMTTVKYLIEGEGQVR